MLVDGIATLAESQVRGDHTRHPMRRVGVDGRRCQLHGQRLLPGNQGNAGHLQLRGDESDRLRAANPRSASICSHVFRARDS